jgi:hypothetical protein
LARIWGYLITIWGCDFIYASLRRAVPTHTMISNNIDKLCLTARLRRLHLEKERAFKSGDRDLYRLAKYTFGRTIKEAKRQDKQSRTIHSQ